MDEQVRILVVDDSATIRTALQLILAPTAYAVEFACSGAEAVDRASLSPPALIMLDFILPDMRGTEVCRALLAEERTRDVPVVLVSARGAEIRQAYQDVDNVVAYLTKPFTPEQVHTVIEDVLARVASGTAFTTSAPTAEPTADAPVAAPTPPAELAPVAAAAWAEPEEEIEDEADVEPTTRPMHAAQRETLDAVFETLRAGLEGVHVEEAETSAGAAESSRSYAELAAQLSRQLQETLAHATSEARFALCSDGSIRSREDALLDTYRRVCRLVLRSVTSGAALAHREAPRPRVLMVGRPDGETVDAANAAAHGGDWHLFRITSGFCQLPLMARLYGPSHLVLDLSGPTVWAELAALRQMSESRRLRIIGVAAAGTAAPDAAELARHGIATVVVAGPRLADDLHRLVSGHDAGAPLATVAEPEAHASAA